jgi:putative transposase
MEPRVLEPDKRKDTVFFSLQTKRKVNGSIEDGKRPFIKL